MQSGLLSNKIPRKALVRFDLFSPIVKNLKTGFLNRYFHTKVSKFRHALKVIAVILISMVGKKLQKITWEKAVIVVTLQISFRFIHTANNSSENVKKM